MDMSEHNSSAYNSHEDLECAGINMVRNTHEILGQVDGDDTEEGQCHENMQQPQEGAHSDNAIGVQHAEQPYVASDTTPGATGTKQPMPALLEGASCQPMAPEEHESRESITDQETESPSYTHRPEIPDQDTNHANGNATESAALQRRQARSLSRNLSIDLDPIEDEPNSTISVLTSVNESMEQDIPACNIMVLGDSSAAVESDYSPEHMRPHLCECNIRVISDVSDTTPATSCEFCRPNAALNDDTSSGYQPSWQEQTPTAGAESTSGNPESATTVESLPMIISNDAYDRQLLNSSHRRVSFSQTPTNSLSVDIQPGQRRLSAPSTGSELGAVRSVSRTPQGRPRHQSSSPVIALPLEECLQDLESQVLQQGIERPTVLTLVHSHSIAEIEGDSSESGPASRRQSLTPEGELSELETIVLPSCDDITPELAPPEDRATPPPTYDQCMKDAVQLSFMDFWPQCLDLQDNTFIYARMETFDHVMKAANRWLTQHPGIIIKNCETIEMKASSQDDYLVSTGSKSTIFKSRYTASVYIKGLRVWYTAKIVNRLPLVFAVTPCTLAYVNIRPSSTEIREGVAYERFPALIEKCNNLIRCGEISGRILNIETVVVKEPESENCAIRNLGMDPDQTVWRDTFHKVALQFLRVFYLPEQPAREEIFYKDILPECIRHSKHHPKYKDFENVMDDCRLWLLKQDHSLRLLNAHTVEGKYSSRTCDMDPHRTFTEGFELAPRIRYLRMYYVKDNPTHPDYMAPLLSHKTFVPIQKKRRQPESLASLMQRVEAWLRATGANVIGAETLPLMEQVYHDKGVFDGSVFRSEWLDGDSDYFQQTLLYVVRIYLDTVYPDPPVELMYPELDGNEECLIL